MATLRKPKLRRAPRMPKKKTASALEAYYKKLEAVEKENKARLKPYQEKLAKANADKKKKETLLKKIDAKKAAIRGL